MREENVLWGAPRIHGELLKLGITVSERTVSRYLPHRLGAPSQTWRTFLANHLGTLTLNSAVTPSDASSHDVIDADAFFFARLRRRLTRCARPIVGRTSTQLRRSTPGFVGGRLHGPTFTTFRGQAAALAKTRRSIGRPDQRQIVGGTPMLDRRRASGGFVEPNCTGASTSG